MMPNGHHPARLDWLDYPDMENKCLIELGKIVFSWEILFPHIHREIRVSSHATLGPHGLYQGQDHFPARINGANSQLEILLPAIRGLEGSLQRLRNAALYLSVKNE